MIFIEYADQSDKNIDYNHLNREAISSNILLSQVIKSEIQNPSLYSIEIETVNRCNNDCSFCPVNINAESREYKIMDEDLFKKIIDELQEQSYSGHISLFSNNEPLLDNRIFDFIKYAKEKLPKAKHCLYTNGLLLNYAKFNSLALMLDKLVIDNYNDDLELNNNIKEILEKIENEKYQCKITIVIRKKNQIRDSRGGLAPNVCTRDKQFNSVCMLPLSQMVIRPDGKVSLCCQDATGKITMGDISKEGIFGIWKNTKYDILRKKLLKADRGCNMICSQCDIFGIVNYRPKSWNLYIIHAFVVWLDSLNVHKIIILGDLKFGNSIRRVLMKAGILSRYIICNEDRDGVIFNIQTCVLLQHNNDAVIEKYEKAGFEVGKNMLICGVIDECVKE